MQRGNWIEAESYYRKALELQNESLPGDNANIAVHYNSVGNFKRAYELLEQMRRNDPLRAGIRGHYMLNLAFSGDAKEADVEYKRCKATFGDVDWHRQVITSVRIGSGGVLSQDKIVYSSPIYDEAKKYLDSPEQGIAALRKLYVDTDNMSFTEFVNIMELAAYLGDPEFAMDVIEDYGNVGFHIWFPVMREVRQLPRFKEFVREIGLVDYWEQFGWPDICRPLDNGDFECD